MIRPKTQKEIQKIKEAGLLLRTVANSTIEIIKPGITTQEIDLFIEKEINAGGGKPTFKGYKGFPASSCISVNDELIHGVPGNRIICDGDVVSIDIGVTLKRAIADSCFSVGIGNVREENKRLLKTAHDSTMFGITLIKSGIKVSEIGSKVCKFIENEGFVTIKEFCGHGTGIDLHEGPQIVFDTNLPLNLGDFKLREGLVITIEPVVTFPSTNKKFTELSNRWTCKTLDGSFAAQFEHTVLVTTDGYEILTGDFGKILI